MKIGYKVVKLWLRTGLFFYFTKIEVHGRAHIPKNKPIMLLANHQNALMDPLMIAMNCGMDPYFLARSDLFKKPLVSRFLTYLQMIPIYRFRDGVDTLKNNPAIFKKCGALLRQGETVMLFPEGNHGILRRVRLPMRKGFARMIFSALENEPDLDIRILPVGLNYKNAAKFPDSASMHIGEDFRVQDFYDPNDLKLSESKLKDEVFKRLRSLTTHIDDETTYDNVLSQLENKKMDFLQPKKINALIDTLDTSHKIDTGPRKPALLKKTAKFLFKIINFPVLLLWNKRVKFSAKDIEFRATLRFMMSILMFPLFYLLEFLILGYAIGQNFAFTFLLAHILFNLAYVKLR